MVAMDLERYAENIGFARPFQIPPGAVRDNKAFSAIVEAGTQLPSQSLV
jgi:hypothetical protein